MIHNHKKLPVELTQQNFHLIDDLLLQTTRKPFDDEVIAFLDAFSGELMSRTDTKRFPELVALGYWMRAAKLQKMAEAFEARNDNKDTTVMTKALGNIVHFCPANVDTMFVYSWVCSLLMGNNNIVRLSSRDSTLQNALMVLLEDLFQKTEFASIAKRNLLTSWPHDDTITTKVCAKVDGRVIWGGDATINKIRSFRCLPRARDITFADRFSICVINCDYLSDVTLPSFVDLLWRDLSAYQQAACSSPRVLVWTGAADAIKGKVYGALQKQAMGQVRSAATVMNHLVTSQLLQSKHQGNQQVASEGIMIQKIDKLSPEYLDWHPAELFMYEYHVESLKRLFEEVPASCQTVSHFGFEASDLNSAVEDHRGRGIDRVVPIGQSLNFSTVWDGHDLFSQFSRELQLLTK